MSTLAYGTMKRLCNGIENMYSSAVSSGIIGDQAHRKRGGYHLSREDNPAGNFSIIRPDDQAGNGPNDAAAGFDISMSRRDMVLATARLRALWANPKDPRRKYLNAFNGWTGTGDATRFDMVARTARYASPDHKWHIHGEIRRRYVQSGSMVLAVLSALRGDTVAVYLAGLGIKPDPVPAAKPGKRGPRPAAPVPPRYPGRVLKAGNRKPDPAVKLWQQRMIARGWRSAGVADGMFGPKTVSIVKRFQKDCKVPADGEIGPKTWPLPWTRPLGS